MKECPICHELVGDTADNCFNCQYSFMLGKIPSQTEREDIIKYQAEKTENEQNFRMRLEQLSQNIQKDKNNIILKNPFYEYQTVQLSDNKSGYLPKERLQSVLDKYSQEGWRLHTITTNIASTSSLGITDSYIGAAKSSTDEITTLVFERCIRPAQY